MKLYFDAFNKHAKQISAYKQRNRKKFKQHYARENFKRLLLLKKKKKKMLIVKQISNKNIDTFLLPNAIWRGRRLYVIFALEKNGYAFDAIFISKQ